MKRLLKHSQIFPYLVCMLILLNSCSSVNQGLQTTDNSTVKTTENSTEKITEKKENGKLMSGEKLRGYYYQLSYAEKYEFLIKFFESALGKNETFDDIYFYLAENDATEDQLDEFANMISVLHDSINESEEKKEAEKAKKSSDD